MSPQHDDAMLDLVAAYAAGALPAGEDECAALRAHLDECETCRRELRRYATAAAAVGVSATQAAPPALRARVLAGLAARRGPRIRQRRAWQVPAAVAAAIAVAAGAWWVHATTAAGPSWALACTHAMPACRVRGSVKAMHGSLRVEMEGLPALPAGKQYQAWIILPGKRPTPEPAFSPDAQGHGTVVMAASPIKGAVVAITIERSGGSPVPTSKPILVAQMQ